MCRQIDGLETNALTWSVMASGFATLAKRVDVALSIDENILVLKVNDDGVGFASTASGGRGLRNLATRSRELGGDCYVDSELGHGTQVCWTANRLD